MWFGICSGYNIYIYNGICVGYVWIWLFDIVWIWCFIMGSDGTWFGWYFGMSNPWGPRGPTRGPAPGICWRLWRWHRHACAWVYPGGPQRPTGHPGGSIREKPRSTQVEPMIKCHRLGKDPIFTDPGSFRVKNITFSTHYLGLDELWGWITPKGFSMSDSCSSLKGCWQNLLKMLIAVFT